ncbi:MAG TPA: YncE family protein [Oscillatoriaceae cyanobacterium]
MKKFGLALLVACGLAGLAYGFTRHPALAADHKVFVTGVLSGVQADSLETGQILKTFDTGKLPHNLLVSPDGKRIYVTNVGSQSVTEIDTQTLTTIKDMLVGAVPQNVWHQKLGAAKFAHVTSCYACHQGAVGNEPVAMAWAGDGHSLLVTEARGRAVAWLDPATGRCTREVHFDLPVPSSPSTVVVDPTTHNVWVLHSYRPPERKQGTGDALAEARMEANFSHDPPLGQHDSFVTVYDPQMKHELKRLRMKWETPSGAVFSPDARLLYVAYRSTNLVAVFDTRAMRLVKTFEVGISPVGLALSNDGRWLYVACLFSKPPITQIVDTRTGAIKASLGIPPSPSRISVDPGTGYLYVTATGSNRVLEIDPVKKKLLRMLPGGHQSLDCALTN